MGDTERELVVSRAVCDGCGGDVLVWEVVGMSGEGVRSDAVIVCDNCGD